MSINHPVEISLHMLLQEVAAGKGEVSEEILDKVADDVKIALRKQLTGKSRKENFSLRMSNLGRPTCQLWFDKNKPELATPMQPFFLMQMLIGDVTEAVMKGLLRAAGVAFTDTETVVLDIADTSIKGSYDLLLDKEVVDIKSASPWSYKNKFEDYETLEAGDSFGYVSQLVGYAKAAKVDVGGWLVINKSNGEFKYLKATPDVEKVLKQIEATVSYINNNEPFKRSFEAEAETFYGKLTGNLVVPEACHFCNYRSSCWTNVRTLPKLVTKASTKEGAMTDYVYVAPEHEEKASSYE